MNRWKEFAAIALLTGLIAGSFYGWYKVFTNLIDYVGMLAIIAAYCMIEWMLKKIMIEAVEIALTKPMVRANLGLDKG